MSTITVIRKQINVDEKSLKRLKFISAFQNKSVKSLMEEAVRNFANSYIEKHLKIKDLTEDEKEDVGLYLLMQESDDERVSRDVFYNEIDELLKE
jgi:hypothetical protein